MGIRSDVQPHETLILRFVQLLDDARAKEIEGETHYMLRPPMYLGSSQ